MRRVLMIGMLVLFASALHAASAAAKGPVEICGADACARLGSEADSVVGFWGQAGRPRVGPAFPAPFFSIRFSDLPGSPLAYWVPAANLLRVGYQGATWVRPSVAEVAVLRAKTKGMRPRSQPRSVTVGVDVEPVRGDLSYLRLYTIGTVTASAAGNGGWLKLQET